jgi:hypothetical protein
MNLAHSVQPLPVIGKMHAGSLEALRVTRPKAVGLTRTNYYQNDDLNRISQVPSGILFSLGGPQNHSPLTRRRWTHPEGAVSEFAFRDHWR